MPELPEAEAARRLAERVAVGRRICAVWCAADPIVFEGVAPARFRKALEGRRVLAAHRHGKHTWLELDTRPWPCFHFGMSGGLHAPADRGVKLVAHGERGGPGAGWPPRFTKLRLTLADGGELAVADARRLGRIRLRHDPAAEPPISLLGFDALREAPSARRLATLLAGRSAPIKAVLLDQSFAAGVGNWIADEALFQARVAPQRPARSLALDEVRRLRAAIRRVVSTAVQLGADSARYPRSWLFHVRWHRNASATTRGGATIRHDTVGGRTTAWVPRVQK
jgi:formamidopyrimidine-DNA glycosylase